MISLYLEDAVATGDQIGARWLALGTDFEDWMACAPVHPRHQPARPFAKFLPFLLILEFYQFCQLKLWSFAFKNCDS